jgi:hypothetical protein
MSQENVEIVRSLSQQDRPNDPSRFFEQRFGGMQVRLRPAEDD